MRMKFWEDAGSSIQTNILMRDFVLDRFEMSRNDGVGERSADFAFDFLREGMRVLNCPRARDEHVYRDELPRGGLPSSQRVEIYAA